MGAEKRQRAQPCAKPWRTVAPLPRHRRPEPLPDLLGCALILLNDGCPPERCMQLCGMQEDDDGESCRTCWMRYLFYVASGRADTPYLNDRMYEEGLKP